VAVFFGNFSPFFSLLKIVLSIEAFIDILSFEFFSRRDVGAGFFPLSCFLRLQFFSFLVFSAISAPFDPFS